MRPVSSGAVEKSACSLLSPAVPCVLTACCWLAAVHSGRPVFGTVCCLLWTAASNRGDLRSGPSRRPPAAGSGFAAQAGGEQVVDRAVGRGLLVRPPVVGVHEARLDQFEAGEERE